MENNEQLDLFEDTNPHYVQDNEPVQDDEQSGDESLADDESDVTADNAFEENVKPLLINLISESKCEEQELEFEPCKRLKNGASKGSANSDDYTVIGFSVRCYKEIWFRIFTNMKDKYRIQVKCPDSMRLNMMEHMADYKPEIIQKYFIQIETPKSESYVMNFIKGFCLDLEQLYLYRCDHEKLDEWGNYACCGSYLECSAAGMCIKNDPKDIKFRKGCAYRKNLKAGRNFFSNKK